MISSTVPQCKDNAPSSYDVLSVMCSLMWEDIGLQCLNIHCDLCWKPEPEMYLKEPRQYQDIIWITCLSCFGPNVVWQECLLRRANPGGAPVFNAIFFWRICYFVEIYPAFIWIILLKNSRANCWWKRTFPRKNSGSWTWLLLSSLVLIHLEDISHNYPCSCSCLVLATSH